MSKSSSSSTEGIATVLIALGVIGGIVALFYLPFGVGPIAAIAVIIGTAASAKNRRLGMYAALFVTTSFVVGAAIAVWRSTSLY